MVCIIRASGSDRIVSNSCQNWGTAVTCLFMVCALKDFKVWRFRSHFTVVKWVYGASKWHLCAKKWFHSFKIPCEMELWLWNWKFLRFGISQPCHNCEMRFTVLRNGTRVPKSGFAAAKSSAEWSFPCENGIFHALVVRSRFAAAKWESLCCEMALVCQIWFRSCENFRKEGPEAAKWFRSKVPISQRLRNLADPCFSPVFDPFLLRKTSFQFLCNSSWFWSSKNLYYIKTIRIKALKSKLKHWNQN